MAARKTRRELESELEDLQSELQEKADLMNDMEEEADRMDKAMEDEAKEWKKQIRSLMAKVKRRDARIQELQASSSSSSSSDNADDDDDDEDTDALFQNSIVSSQMQRLRQELAACQSTNAKLQEKVDGAELQSFAISELQSEIAQLQNEKQEAEESAADADAGAAALERELMETRARLAARDMQCREKEKKIRSRGEYARRNFNSFMKLKKDYIKAGHELEIWQALALELQDRFRGPWSVEFGDFIDDFIGKFHKNYPKVEIDELISELKRDYVRQQYEPLPPPSNEKQQMPPSKRKRNNLIDLDKLRF